MKWSEIVDLAVEFRHTLHENPELTWHEKNTAQRIRQMLDEHKISWRECAQYGTVATIGKNLDRPSVALRADIDALEIDEKTGLEYASKTKGVMHACGHDGHSATLMAVALYLKSIESSLEYPVTLLFQPAEEGGHGAKAMIEDGALDGVSEIYGWHNWPAIKFAKALCPDKTVMAGNGTFHIEVIGKGGHASQPELCSDPILAASAITLALQQIVSRFLAPQDAAVVSVTSIDGRSGLTSIPDSVLVEGSIRVPDELIRKKVQDAIIKIVKSSAKAYKVEAKVEIRPRYKATINHPLQAKFARKILQEELGESYLSDLPLPIMASEDFSYYLNERPGAFMLIGADDGKRAPFACHNCNYDFNDKLIEPVSKVLIKLATKFRPRD